MALSFMEKAQQRSKLQELDAEEYNMKGRSKSTTEVDLQLEIRELKKTIELLQDEIYLLRNPKIIVPKIKDIDGIVYEVHNISKFAREHNINRTSLSRLLSHNLDSISGFTRA